MISGIGLAIAKIIGFVFICFTISSFSTQPTDTHMKTSAHTIASLSVPEILLLLVIFNISFLTLFKSFLVFEIIHLLSHAIIFFTQYR
jgi:uncharacterized membrane protein